MRQITCLLTVVLALLSIRTWAGGAPTLSQIDGPAATFTDATGINNRGEIVGTYADAQGLHGYLFKRGDLFTLDVPVEGALTLAFGINDRRQIVGNYRSQGLFHGFLWSHGKFTDININAPNADETFLHGINNRGHIIGHSRRDLFSLAQGFLLAKGTFTFLNIPGVLIVGRNRESMGLNDRGQIVGTFQSLGDGVNHGFLLDNGVLTQIDVPGAIHTWAAGINNRGQIIGSFLDASFMGRAYIRDKDGSFSEIEAPNYEGIAGVRINDRSDIVGMVNDSAGFHGFVLSQGFGVDKFQSQASLRALLVPLGHEHDR